MRVCAGVVQFDAVAGAVDLLTLQKEVERGLATGQISQDQAMSYMAANAARVMQVTPFGGLSRHTTFKQVVKLVMRSNMARVQIPKHMHAPV